MIQKNISLSGDTNFLKDLIKNRITDRMLHKITENSKQSLTIHFETGNYLKNEINIPSIIVRPWHKQIIPFALDNCIELHIRDLLCIDSEGEFGPKVISYCIDNPLSNHHYCILTTSQDHSHHIDQGHLAMRGLCRQNFLL